MLTPEEEVELFLKEKSECYKRTKVSIMDDTLEGFHQGRNESYRTPEDRLDADVAPQTLQVTNKVVDLLKGESKRNWQRKFGDC